MSKRIGNDADGVVDGNIVIDGILTFPSLA